MRKVRFDLRRWIIIRKLAGLVGLTGAILVCQTAPSDPQVGRTSGVTELTLPSNPTLGLGFAFDGSILMGKPSPEGVRLVQYRRNGNRLVEMKLFEQKFVGPLEIMPKRDGVAVVDYESGEVMEIGMDGKTKWTTRVRLPTLARLDSAGNIWMTFNSGYLYWKTQDSSEPEPILRPNGAEVVLDYVADFLPIGHSKFYFLDTGVSPAKGGELYVWDITGEKKLITTVPGDRMIASKLGGVLTFKEGVIRHVSVDGKVRKLWTAPEQFGRRVRFFDRMRDGRLIVAAPAEGGGGTALILPLEVEE